MKPFIVLLGLALSQAQVVSAEPAVLLSPAQFQEQLEALRQPLWRRPGVVAAAVRVDKATVFAAAGVSEMSERISANADTTYPWFSVTKLFTTMAVLQLYEQGKVDLNAPLSRYVPEFRPKLGAWASPTVAQFLSHSSGIPALSVLEKFRAIHLAADPAPNIQDLLIKWTQPGEALQFEPGSRFQYSNAGFLWLGRLVELVSGEAYEDYVKHHILKPLKMDRTGFAHADLSKAARGYARSSHLSGMLGALLGDERFDAGKIFSYRAIRYYYVDGPSFAGLVGPTRDMARFALCLLQDGHLEGKRLLKKETCALARQARQDLAGKTLPCGLGWFVEPGLEKVVFHEGLGGGYKTQLRLYPERGFGMVVAVNEADFDTKVVAKWVVSPPLDKKP